MADRIKSWRAALGLTQAEFAQRAGMPKASLIGYEVGQRKPGADALAAIAKTGVNVTWLLTGEGDMLPAEKEIQEKSAAYDSKHGRRWRQIIDLVESIDDDQAREALLQEMFARAHDKAEIAQLHRAVRDLRAASSKSP